MAPIRGELHVEGGAEEVWDAIAEVGAVHTRLAPGFVIDTRLEGGARVVTFGNGLVARELIVDVDHGSRRLVWRWAVGAPPITTRRCKAWPRPSGAAGGSVSRACLPTS